MSGNNGVTGYIHDGYTIDGYVSAAPRLYPDLHFTYRPVLTQNRAVIYKEMQRTDDPRKSETVAAQAIKAQISSWNLVKQDGSAVPLEVDDILRVQPYLMNRLFRIIMGDEAPDEDPCLTDTDHAAGGSMGIESALAGAGPEEREAAAGKNSGTG